MTATGALAPIRRIDRVWARRMAVIGALIALRILLVGVVLDSPGAYKPDTAFQFDAARYHHIAEENGRPYRDFPVEYPPGTLAFVEAVNGRTVDTTMQNLAVATLLLDFIAALGVAYGWGRRALTTYLAIGLPFLLVPFIYFRVDLLSVALAIWGMALVKRRQQVGGGLVLAGAVLAKFWPLALVPALLVRRQWRATVAFGSAAVVAGLGWLAYAGVDGPRQVLTFRGATGWNTESLVGNVARLVTHGPVYEQAGAIRTGHMPGWSSPLLGFALAALVIAIWWRVARQRVADDVLISGVAPVVATGAFLVCSPVLSPQYMIWLAPFAAICWAGGQRRITGLVGAANVLTMLLSMSYHDLYKEGAGAYALLTARNILLLVIIAEGFRVTRAAPRESRDTSARATEPQSTLPGAEGAPLMSSMR